MKRKIFFWLEKMKITPGERKVVAGLLVVLVLLASLNLVLSPSEPFEEGHYLELEKQFKKRTEILQENQEQLMARYNPTEKEQLPLAQTTSNQPDSVKQKAEEKGGNAQEQRINVNKADRETLESLPGIGPTYAGRIIKYRKKYDGFDTLSELKKIKGIAEKRLDNLKPFIKLKDSR